MSPEEHIFEQRVEDIKNKFPLGGLYMLKNGSDIVRIICYHLGSVQEYPISAKGALSGKILRYNIEGKNDKDEQNDILLSHPISKKHNIEPTKEFMKDDKEKPLVSLVEPDFILGIAEIMTQGAIKYEENNWKKCKQPKRYLNALLRHLLEYWRGNKIDKESGKSHLYHIGFNAMALDYFDRKE